MFGQQKTASEARAAQNYLYKERHGEILDTVRASLGDVMEIKPVANLTGQEFQKVDGDARSLRAKVIDFFNSIGNKVTRSDIGDIELITSGARDSVAHGYGKLKSATFAALPQVLEQGKIIAHNAPYEGHNYDSYIISAPVTVDGEKVYVGALVIKDLMQRYKLHEVLVTNESGASLFKSETTSQAANGPLRNDTPLGEPEGSPTDTTISPEQSGVKIEDMQGVYAPFGESIDSLIERMYNETEPDHSEVLEVPEPISSVEQALIDTEWNGGASDFGASPVPLKEDATFETKIPVYAPPVNESITKAARHAVLKGTEHQGEHLVLVDSVTGEWAFEEAGDDRSVGNSGAFRDFVAQHPQGRFVYVHSHPSGMPFSLNDMAEFFGDDQFDGMVAAGYNGKVYTVYGKRAKISIWSEVMKPEVDGSLLQDLRELRKDGKISEEFFRREVECRRVQYLTKFFCAEMEAET